MSISSSIFKLMNSPCYDKIPESKRDRVSVHLIVNSEALLKRADFPLLCETFSAIIWQQYLQDHHVEQTIWSEILEFL